MSIKCMSRVWDQSIAKGSRLLLLLAIADFADDNGYCFPSMNTLAKKIRMSRGSVIRLVAELVNSEELYRISRGNVGRSNRYIVMVGLNADAFVVSLVRGGLTEAEARERVYQVGTPQEMDRGCTTDGSGVIDGCNGGDLPVSPDPSLSVNDPPPNHRRDFLDDVFTYSRSENAEKANVAHRPEGWQTPDIREEEFEICKLVADLWLQGKMPTIARFIDAQVEAAGALLKLHDSNDRATRETIRSYFDKYEEQWRRTVRRPFTVLGPQSLVGVVTSYLADLDRAEAERMPPPGGRVTT